MTSFLALCPPALASSEAIAFALLLAAGVVLAIGIALPEVRGRWRAAAGRLSVWGGSDV